MTRNEWEDARRSLLLYRLLFPFVHVALIPGVLLRMLQM